MAQLNKPSLISMLKTVVLAALIVTLPILVVRFLGGFERLELAAYDQFLRWRSPEGIDDRIVVMTIDDDDIEVLQQYPIEDGTLAKALDKLASYEPRGIGLDISRDVPHGPKEGRRYLTQVIKDNPFIISGCLLSTENHPGSPPAPGAEEGSIAFADFPIDPDASVRRAKLVSTPGNFKKLKRTKHICNDSRSDNELPSLSFQLALLYLGDLQVDPEPTESGEIQLSQTILKRINSRFGGYADADVNDYQLMLNYRGGQQLFRQIPITDVLNDKVDPRSIRDRIVLVGYTSEVSKDYLKTPYIQPQTGSQEIFGVLVHAHAVSQILSAVINERLLIQSWQGFIQVIWILGWALGSGLIAFYTRRITLFFLGFTGVGVALWGIGYGLFFYQGLWIPVVPTLVVVMLTAIGVRVADVGSRSGYAQAIYEQLLDQFRSNAAQRNRKGDYLESLVQRARIARQGPQEEGTSSQVSLEQGQIADRPDIQALYAQVAAQMGTERKGDYLESLVQRARSTRQGQAAEEGTSSLPSLEQAQIGVRPDMQAIYEQVAAQVRQELALEQVKQPATVEQSISDSKLDRIHALLERAQQARKQSPPKPITYLPEQRSAEESPNLQALLDQAQQSRKQSPAKPMVEAPDADIPEADLLDTNLPETNLPETDLPKQPSPEDSHA